jgi:hypothetical protein
MNKAELLEALATQRNTMTQLLEDLPDETLLEPGVMGDWSIKDILGHLTHWEGQMVTLLFQVSQGISKPTTAHFGPDQLNVLNQRWYEAGKDRSLDMVWQDWVNVRKQVIRRVSEIQEKDLSNPRQFAWLKGKPLMQWILDETVEHEKEHLHHIQDWLITRNYPSRENGKLN